MEHDTRQGRSAPHSAPTAETPVKGNAADWQGEAPLSSVLSQTTRTSGSGGRVCRLCGALITGRRRNGFCSDRCRMRAKRQEQERTVENTLRVLLTAAEVAELLRTSRKAVYAMTERGQLPGVTRIGRRLLFRHDALLDWLHERRAPSPEGDRR